MWWVVTWTFGSLFSGIGGLDLGLERAGWECRWQVEINPYCQRVLAKHWPDVTRYSDVREVCWEEVEPVDLICGGFPCQPVSFAGKRRAQDDEQWLWPEFGRALRVLRPRLALLENVPGLLTAGFDDVQADLAELRYDTEWDCLPASAVGAPHLRYRVVVVAHANGVEHQGDSPAERRPAPSVLLADTDSSGRRRRAGEPGASGRSQPADSGDDMAHANGGRQQERGESHGGTVEPGQQAPRRGDADGCGANVGDTDRPSEDAYAEAGRPRRAASEPGWWAVEPDVGRVAYGVPRRVDRLRGLGNAVVPQLAEWIGRRLMEAA